MKNKPPNEIIARKEAILFDLFHTLVSVRASGGPSTHDILGVSRDDWHEQLMEKTMDRLTGKMREPEAIIRKMARDINPDIPDDTIKKAALNRVSKFAQALINVPAETTDVLKKLKQWGKKIALVSNAEFSEITAWQDSPLAPFFDGVIFSCDVGAVKPEKKIYELAMEKLGEKPENCVFVGDGGSNELMGARDMGITTIMITRHIKDIPEEKINERIPHADFVIETLDELVYKKNRID